MIALTAEQQHLMEQHTRDDAVRDVAPAKLTRQQQTQLDRDLERLLPNGPPTEVPKGLDAAPGRLQPATALPELQVEKFEPVTEDISTAVDPRFAATGWRYRAFPKGGLVYHDKPSWMQRVDQGQDFEIPWGAHIIAPGWGHVVSWLNDRPFPNGFGSPYMVIYVGDGRFGGRLWYLGHMNYVQLRPGESFHAGRPLGRLYNSLNAGRGWIEYGHAANGFPMSMAEGARWRGLFTTPAYRWSY